MEKFKITTIAALTLAALSFAPAAVAENTGGECLSDCDPEPRVKGNNGLGNGDQPAPGNSLEHNKAENQLTAPGHASGKAQIPD